MRRDTALRCVFLGHVRLCTLPAKSLARLVSLASPRLRIRTESGERVHACRHTRHALNYLYLCVYDGWCAVSYRALHCVYDELHAVSY